ncbi:hypothetical protein GCM10010218_27520 [Streptomyces mashuensis]|uniref:DUF559 domain-containing protein n=1 Tax=Streptomyces mashuensis TaxID=33904 RepID=A0A919ED34_9ACTN|nr:hypothetical protein [Streptomyces mashuensis]GHF44593.1 hypothetical protein GCM10010218_27520 [Streptomyces mashuensis]
MTGDELRALAESQGGVVLAAQAQALESGWTRARLRRVLTKEGWTRVRPGAWLLPGRPVGEREALWAHQLAHPAWVAGHWSAARLHGIVPRAPRTEFIGEGAAPKDVVLRRLPLPAADVTVTAGGLRTTTVARTLADLLRAGPRDEVLVAVDAALGWRHRCEVEERAGPGGPVPSGRRGPPLTTVDAVGRALTTAPELRGASRAAWWLALADPKAGSPAETIARLRMHDAGLYPETQVMLVVPTTGRRVYPDFLFREAGLVVETEGYAWHGSRAQHQRDVERFNDLAACPEVGSILRFTARDVFDRPDVMIRDIRAALSRGRGRG